METVRSHGMVPVDADSRNMKQHLAFLRSISMLVVVTSRTAISQAKHDEAQPSTNEVPSDMMQ